MSKIITIGCQYGSGGHKVSYLLCGRSAAPLLSAGKLMFSLAY